MVVARGWERGNGGLVFSRGHFPFGKTKRFWRWTVVMVAQQCESTKCCWTTHLKTVMVINLMHFYHNLKYTHTQILGLNIISQCQGSGKSTTKSKQYFLIMTRTTNSIFIDLTQVGKIQPVSFLHTIARSRLSLTFTQGLLQKSTVSLMLLEVYFRREVKIFTVVRTLLRPREDLSPCFG